MNRSRPLARTILVVVAALAASGCATTTSPSLLAGLPSASPSLAITSAGPSPSSAPQPTRSNSPKPTDPTEPSEAPTPTPSPIAGCGTGEAGFLANASEIPKTLHFGGATIEYASAGVGMRDGSWPVDDVIPGGVGLTPDEIAVVVGPGDHILLHGSNIVIENTQASASAWSMVTFSGDLANLGGPKTALDWRVRADGSLSVSAPDQVGDWAVEFLPQWQGDCLEGNGTAYARIKVR